MSRRAIILRTRTLTALAGMVALLALGGVHLAGAAGVVFVNGADTTSDAGGCGTVANPCNTIQAGINNANSGDTVQVAAGTYTENLTLPKSLTLRGMQAGINACGRMAVGGESIVTGSGLLLDLVAGSAGSTIDGFTFSGGTRAIESHTGPINDLQIRNNRIRGFTNAGVFLNDNGTNITADQNEIDGTAKTGAGDLFHLDQDNFDGFWFTNNCVMNGATATGFFVDGTRNVDAGTAGSRIPRFTGNTILSNQTGVNLGRLAWGDGPITRNTFARNGFDGLQGGPKNALINENTFDGNGRDGLALTSFGNTTDPARGAQNNNIVDNCFTRNGFTNVGEGIFFSATQFPATISTNKANRNNITGNRLGARYAGTETIDATSNWWGAANGPGPPNGTGSGDGVSGAGIVFTPFLVAPNPATPACPAGVAATLTLSPKTATNDVSTQHCVTATVRDTAGNPIQGLTVRFSVSGSVNTSGSATTNTSGQAVFCYTGPGLPGADAIRAFADNDNDQTQDPNEPFDTASKAWTLPTSTPVCVAKITQGGWMTANNGDRASFGGNAQSDAAGNVKGQEQYQDHGPAQPQNVNSIRILALTCNQARTQATIFGNATINGAGTHAFRIDVQDLAEPGKGIDTYRILLDTGYDSGVHTLKGGNVQIH
jgi:hypothetical protein